MAWSETPVVNDKAVLSCITSVEYPLPAENFSSFCLNFWGFATLKKFDTEKHFCHTECCKDVVMVFGKGPMGFGCYSTTKTDDNFSCLQK